MSFFRKARLLASFNFVLLIVVFRFLYACVVRSFLHEKSSDTCAHIFDGTSVNRFMLSRFQISLISLSWLPCIVLTVLQFIPVEVEINILTQKWLSLRHFAWNASKELAQGITCRIRQSSFVLYLYFNFMCVMIKVN